MKVSSKLGFLKLFCRGVNDVIGDINYVEGSCPAIFRVPVGLVGVE
jgi:hypothetical protein